MGAVFAGAGRAGDTEMWINKDSEEPAMGNVSFSV